MFAIINWNYHHKSVSDLWFIPGKYFKLSRFFFFFSCLGSPHLEMPTHSSILAWRISWAEEPGGLQSMGSHRVRHTHSPPVHLWRITSGRRHPFTHLSSTQELYAERSYRAGRDPLQARLILQVPNKPCGVRGLVRCVTERS